jgi:transcriptional regulator with XRE-family HTH domain
MERAAIKAPKEVATDKYVGSKVRMFRMMLRITQQELGEALGLTFQQVQKYEKGRNRISASTLQKISHVLNVPVALFFEGVTPAKGMKPDPTSPVLPDFVSEFLGTSDGLTLVEA